MCRFVVEKNRITMKRLLLSLLFVLMTTTLLAADRETMIKVQSDLHPSMNFTITLKSFQRMFRFMPTAVRDRAKREYKWFREQNFGDADFKRGSMDCKLRMASDHSMTFVYRGITGTVSNAHWERLDDVFDYKPTR